LCVAVLEFDRARQGGIDPGSSIGHFNLLCRRAVLPNFIHIRRYSYGGLWLRARSPRRLGRICRAGVRIPDGGRRGPSATSELGRENQAAVEAIFGNTPRIVCGLDHSFLCGTFVNSYVLAKMKIWTSDVGYGRAWWVPRFAVNWWTPRYSIRSRFTAGYRNLIW